MAVYTISCPTTVPPLVDATFASVGITSHSTNLVDQAPDTVILQTNGADWDDAPLLPYQSQVTIKQDGTIIFIGTCITDPRMATGRTQQISYRILGPWYWLEATLYEQQHQRWSGLALEPAYQPNVVLNYSATGTRWNSGQQITDAINYAIAKGAPITLGTISPDIQIPYEDVTAIKCSEVIVRQMRWSPDYAVWWDYTAVGGPAINITHQSAMPATNVNINDLTSPAADIKPRYDLQRPGVELTYETTVSTDDGYYINTTTDSAGTIDSIHTLRATIPLTGTISGYSLSQEIEVDDFPFSGDPLVHDWLNVPWWQERVPSIAQIDAADITLHDETVIIEKDPDTGLPLYDIDDLPRYIVEGTVQPWMKDGGVKAANIEITVLADITIRKPDNTIARIIKNRPIALKTVGTDAITKEYRAAETISAIEDVPTGVAASLYTAVSRLQFDGTITIIGQDPAAGYRPGQKFNILGGNAEWATMGAIIRNVVQNSVNGSTRITFGPAKNLGADDIVSLLKRIRTSRQARLGMATKLTGKPELAENVTGGHPAKNQVDNAPGEINRERVVKEAESTDPYTSEIDINPDVTKENPSETTDIVIKPRELPFPEDDGEGGTQYRLRQVLVSEPYGEATENPEGGSGDNPTGPCDQNNGPGDSDTGGEDDDGTAGPGDQDSSDDTGGSGPGDDDDDGTGGPGDQDCYSTIPDPLPTP